MFAAIACETPVPATQLLTRSEPSVLKTVEDLFFLPLLHTTGSLINSPHRALSSMHNLSSGFVQRKDLNGDTARAVASSIRTLAATCCGTGEIPANAVPC